MVSALKDPIKVQAGIIGARTRWAGHEPKVIRLDELTPPQRRLVIALVDAAKAETHKADPVGEMSGSAQEFDGGDRRLPQSA